jgi:hypothetical protein
MHRGFGTLLLLVALAAMHWRFIDMWFNVRGGLKWFWRAPSPPLPLMLARLSFIAMIIAVALATSLASTFPLIVSIALIFVHMGLLVLVSERPR